MTEKLDSRIAYFEKLGKGAQELARDASKAATEISEQDSGTAIEHATLDRWMMVSALYSIESTLAHGIAALLDELGRGDG